MDAKLNRERLEVAVVAAMDSASRLAMVWGKDDCALWAVEPVRKALGYDPAARFRGRYRTRIGAVRALGKGGLASALRLAARKHGWRRVESIDAQSGDLGLLMIDGIFSMVVCRAPGWFVGRNEQGYTAVKSGAIRFVWSVV